MGNLLSHNKNNTNNNAYEPFINNNTSNYTSNYTSNLTNQIDMAEQIQKLTEKTRFLETALNSIKMQLDNHDARIDTSIQNKSNELLNFIMFHNEKTNEKIIMITKDMENLLNNDKILLDKLIEKNIVSIIQED